MACFDRAFVGVLLYSIIHNFKATSFCVLVIVCCAYAHDGQLNATCTDMTYARTTNFQNVKRDVKGFIVLVDKLHAHLKHEPKVSRI